MKRISTLFCLLLVAVLGARAQEAAFQFADKDGNIVPTGSTLVRNNAEVDDFGSVQIPSGLFVKNVSGGLSLKVRLDTRIEKIENGALQVCFPINCFSYDKPDTYVSETTQLAASEAKDIQSEWLPEAWGECLVTYEAVTFQPEGLSFTEQGRATVTLRYVYADPANVALLSAANGRPARYYDAQGRQLKAQRRGLNLVRMADGSVRKQLVR